MGSPALQKTELDTQKPVNSGWPATLVTQESFVGRSATLTTHELAALCIKMT